MLVLLVTQLGIGLYALINYDALIEKGLFVTLNAAKDQQKIFNAWEHLQHEVSISLRLRWNDVKCSIFLTILYFRSAHGF